MLQSDKFKDTAYFGERIKELRLLYELNMPGAAKFCKINKGSWFKWESNKVFISLPNLRKIILPFGISHEEFFSSTPFKTLINEKRQDEIRNSEFYLECLTKTAHLSQLSKIGRNKEYIKKGAH